MSRTLADLMPREYQHLGVCVHESGHAVAAVALGGVVRSAVVASGRVSGVQGLTTLDTMPLASEPLIAYAGPWSQGRWQAGRRPTQRQLFALLDGGGRGDRDQLCAHGGSAAGLDVVPLLDRCWPGVVAVAKGLYRTGEVRQADVLAALGITDGGGPGSVQLASLRAGLRAVPNTRSGVTTG